MDCEQIHQSTDNDQHNKEYLNKTNDYNDDEHDNDNNDDSAHCMWIKTANVKNLENKLSLNVLIAEMLSVRIVQQALLAATV